jgi:hypothetical protein
VDAIAEISATARCPLRLADVGIKADDLTKLADDAMSEDALAIYSEAFGNGAA